MSTTEYGFPYITDANLGTKEKKENFYAVACCFQSVSELESLVATRDDLNFFDLFEYISLSEKIKKNILFEQKVVTLFEYGRLSLSRDDVMMLVDRFNEKQERVPQILIDLCFEQKISKKVDYFEQEGDFSEQKAVDEIFENAKNSREM